MKTKKGPTIVLLITVLILVVFVSLEIFSQKERSNVTPEQTQESLKAFQEKYDTKYLTVTLKDNAKVSVVKELALKYKAEINYSEQDINNYTLEFEKQLDSETALNILEKIQETKGIAYAGYLTNEDSQGNYFNSDNPENDKVFEAAMANYQNPVSVYYDDKGQYTFLYPSAYVVSENKDGIDLGEGKIIIASYVSSNIGLMEDVVNDIIGESINEEIVKESYTMYDTEHTTIATWFDGTVYEAVVQDQNGYYKVSAVDQKEFELIVQSFYVNN